MPKVQIYDMDLPVYSVLVPLFRETSVLGQLLTALTSLDYPALCIKRTKRPEVGREGVDFGGGLFCGIRYFPNRSLALSDTVVRWRPRH